MGGRITVNSMLILLQKREENPLKMSTRGTQYAERILNKIAKAINETFAGLKFMLQRFRIYFFRNPSIKGIESTS